MFINQFKVKTRLLVLTVLVIAAQVVVCAFAISTIDKIRIGSDTYNEIKHYKDLYASAHRLENHLNSTRAVFVTMIFTEDKDQLEQLKGKLENYLGFVKTSFHQTEDAIGADDPEIRSALELAHFTWHEFKDSLLEEFIPLMFSGDRQEATQLINGQGLRLQRFVEQVDSALNVINFRMQAIENEAYVIVSRNQKLLFAVMAILMVFLISVTLFIARSIIYPLGKLSKAAKILGEGNLGFRAAVSGNDELSELAISLNQMAAKLVESQEMERKKAAESKKAADWENTFNSIQDLVSIQTTDLKYVRVNKAFLTAFNVEPEDVLGQKSSRFFAGACHGEDALSCVETANMNKNSTCDMFNPVTEREYHITISPLYNQRGELVGIVHVAKDITGLKAQERRTRQLQEELLHSQKMESIGTMANGIAHNLNNILAIIRGYVELSLLDESLTAEVRRDLIQVVEAVDHAKELARNMLVFSRHQEIHVKPEKIKSIIQHGLQLFRGSMSCPLDIAESLGAGDPVVLVDANQMQQVLMNLCNNAYQAVENTQGKLEITLNEIVLGKDARPRFSKLQPGEYVKLSLKDNGTGMSKETMSRIFEPFFTTKNVDQGTGLGLSTVHGIVVSHGGEITVASELGKGSEFTIYLPKVQRESV